MNAHDYISSIRNHKKRMYAIAYLEYCLEDGIPYPERGGKGQLSFMAAQSVRFNIEECLKSEIHWAKIKLVNAAPVEEFLNTVRKHADRTKSISVGNY